MQRVRNTETHYEETIPLVQEQPYDQFVDSSTVELEQSNAQYDITHCRGFGTHYEEAIAVVQEQT